MVLEEDEYYWGGSRDETPANLTVATHRTPRLPLPVFQSQPFAFFPETTSLTGRAFPLGRIEFKHDQEATIKALRKGNKRKREEIYLGSLQNN